ncbi:MAG: tyrosine-protein kinase domain-containing protein [Acidimicrobiales bacterium]
MDVALGGLESFELTGARCASMRGQIPYRPLGSADVAAPPSAESQPQLLQYGRTLWRRKWTILVVTLLAAGAAFGFSEAETPVYSSTASVLLQSSASSQVIGNGANVVINPADEIQLIESPGVASLVRKKIGSAPPISAASVTGTDVITITASSRHAVDAARIANAYANAYVQYRQTSAVDSLLGAAQTTQARVTAVQAQITKLNASIASAPPSQKAAVTATVTPEITALQQQVSVLLQQVSTLQSDASLSASGAQVVGPAVPPSSPSSPRKLRNDLVGLGGGLILGIALAFVREALDDSIVTKEDLDRAQPGLPVLGEIPLSGATKGSVIDLISASRPHSLGAEAYRSLRTSVQFLCLDRSIRTLQLTSPRTTEGKTTTISNLAIALVGAGLSVIAVDCDLRRPRLHEPFGLSADVGFTSVLLDQVPLEAALRQVSGHEGLRILASGKRPPNPSELLSTQRARDVLHQASELADLVLIDSPPTLPVTDAVALAPAVDAVILVVSSGSTTAKDVARSLEILGQVDAPVVGAVLNGISQGNQYGYRYRYGGYSYGPPVSEAKAERGPLHKAK